MDKEMIKFSEIINSYTRPKFGELSINEKALAKYEEFCLDLIKQLKKKDEVIEKAVEYVNKHKHLNWYVESCYTNDLLQILEDREVE